jgi:glutamate dehydrogenase/leucine dehydrogenase
MNLLDGEHEQVDFFHDASSGLRAIVAIHSTKLGPSLGGTRFYPFASADEALADVLRLSKAMTYKSSAAGLDFGGGKAVIIGDPRKDKSDDLLRAYAGFVQSLSGRYITTEDVGTTQADMDLIAQHTEFVTGTSTGSGDPSEATGWGVFSAMRTIAKRLWDADSLEGRHVAIQGVGKVGSYIAGHLADDGCRLTVADIFEEAAMREATRHHAKVVSPDDIHAVECDIVSPCALSGEINSKTVPEMRCAAIVGCANNQLDDPSQADALAKRNIIYAPDFIVNAGGVINIAHEVGQPYDKKAAFDHAWRIGETIGRVLDVAESEGITTELAAEHIAEARLH